MFGKETAKLLRKCFLLSSILYFLLSVYMWRASRTSYDKHGTTHKQCSEYFCSSSNCPGEDHGEDSNKWVVLVDPTIGEISVKKLRSLRGWNVVIIGDERMKVKRKLEMKNIHFITIQQQQELGFTPEMLSHNRVRKNVGYIYAIKRGAKFIYDLDEDMEMSENELSLFDYEEGVSGLLYSTKNDLPTREKLFNPYSFFSNPGAAPVSLEWNFLENHTNVSNGLHLCRKIETAAVQEVLTSQGTADSARIGATIESNDASGAITLPISVAPGTFSLWTLKNTVFRYDAFFVLGIPILKNSRREEILRSLFTQKLLHIVGRVVTFHSSNLLLRGENTSALSTEDAELFFKVVEFLDSWKCPHEQISMCMVTLADEFRLKGYWDKETTTIVRIWVDNLIPLGYNFRSVSKDGFDCQLTFDETSRDQNCRRANIHLPYSLRTGTNMSEEIKAMRSSAFEDLTNWCAQGNYNEPKCLDKEQHQDELAHTNANNSVQHTHLNKVLVIINNHPRKKGIGMLQRLYQPYFGMTIFCGSYSPMEYRDEGEFPKIIHPFNYIHISRGELLQGYFFHYCLAKVKELRLRNVEGYFFTADDAIFHFWHALDLSEILFPVWVNQHRTPSIWWPSRYGRRAAERAVQLFTTKYKHNKRISKALACYQEGVRLIASAYKERAISHIASDNGRTLSDFFYVPEKRMAYFAEAIEIFFEAGLFVELVMNKLLQTVPHNRLPRELFEYIPEHSRHRWTEFYSSDKVMVHPIKINEYADVRKRKQFCKTVVHVFRQTLLKCNR